MSEDMIRKIAGLLATAESYAENGNDEAAQSYIAKAHELQSKYNIDQDMLQARNAGKVTDKIISKVIKLPGGFGRRRVSLAHSIATASDCTGYFGHTWPTKKITLTEDSWEVRQGRSQAGEVVERTDYDAPKIYTYTVFGFSRDVEWVETLCDRLNMHLTVALSHGMKSKPRYENHKTWGTVFVQHYAYAIHNRLMQAKRQAQAEAQAAEQNRLLDLTKDAATVEEAQAILDASGGPSVALVLADKKKRVKEEMTARVGKLGTSRTSSGYSSSAANAGRAAGNRANIGRSVGGGNGGALGR